MCCWDYKLKTLLSLTNNFACAPENMEKFLTLAQKGCHLDIFEI